MPFFSRIAELDIETRLPWPFVDLGAIDAILSFSVPADLCASDPMIDRPRLATKEPNEVLSVSEED